MKITRAEDNFLVQFGVREKQLFFDLLKLYPCIPSAAPGKAKRKRTPIASERLLDEALAEQRAQNYRQLQRLLSERDRWQKNETGFRLSLAAGEVEWLLQVLNDIRVGSWIRLGSPDEKMELSLFSETTLPHFWAMDLAGRFEMEFLHALRTS